MTPLTDIYERCLVSYTQKITNQMVKTVLMNRTNYFIYRLQTMRQ